MLTKFSRALTSLIAQAARAQQASIGPSSRAHRRDLRSVAGRCEYTLEAAATMDSQASMIETNEFYGWATILILIIIGLIWLLKKPEGPLQQGAH